MVINFYKLYPYPAAGNTTTKRKIQAAGTAAVIWKTRQPRPNKTPFVSMRMSCSELLTIKLLRETGQTHHVVCLHNELLWYRPSVAISAFAVQHTKFDHLNLIIRKIIKNVATRCYLLKLKCTKFDPTGELIAFPRPPIWIKGVLILRGGRERKGYTSRLELRAGYSSELSCTCLQTIRHVTLTAVLAQPFFRILLHYACGVRLSVLLIVIRRNYSPLYKILTNYVVKFAQFS